MFRPSFSKILLVKRFNYQGDSHKHGAQFEKVIVLWIFHLYYSPWVKTTSDLLPFNFNQLVGANHSEGNARLAKVVKNQQMHKKL